MSHFCVLVIGDNPEEQLAPYQENNMGDTPEEYLAFHDIEDERRKEYETNTTEMVRMPDGSLISAYESRFYVLKDPKDPFSNQERVVPEGCTLQDIPLKERYKTFEEYMTEYEGKDSRDEKTGRYGYWENPHAKWDWYELGGRWTGFFKLKHRNTEATLGKPGVFGNTPTHDCDQAKKSQIDFQGMMDAAGDEARAKYEKVEKAFGGTIPRIEYPWSQIIDDKNEKFNKMSIEEKQEFYHNQEALKTLQAIQECNSTKTPHDKDDDFFIWLELEDYQYSKEEFMERARADAVTTFAVVKDGKWYEKGEMGWWGIVSNEKDNGEWSNRVTTLIEELPGDTLMSVYDCHI